MAIKQLEKGNYMTTATNLIERGFWAKELPPPFVSATLANNLAAVASNVPSKFSPTRAEAYSIPRVKTNRRYMGGQDPFRQALMALEIEQHWPTLVTHFGQSTLSMSKPTIRGSRALLPEKSYGEMKRLRPELSVGCRFLLKTDITRFYPSIYTHSVPWALHTKATAKAQRRSMTLLGNRLDQLLRDSQDGQTMGVAIGPDTSLVIAEIIGCSIDGLLQASGIQDHACRYVDDFFVYCRTQSDAESAYAAIARVLHEFELEPNHTKTEILQLPEILEDRWASELRLYPVRDNSGQPGDLVTFFSKAYEHSLENPSEGVLKYAMQKAKTFAIELSNWPLFESLILRSVIDEPSVLPHATDILVSHQVAGYPLRVSLVAEALNEVINHHAPLGHTFEVAWSLWMHKALGISLSRAVTKPIEGMDSGVVALLALDLQNSGLTQATLNSSYWQSLMVPPSLHDGHWLLSYEADQKSWLPGHPTQGNAWNALVSLGVEFYDVTKTHPTFPVSGKDSQHDSPIEDEEY